MSQSVNYERELYEPSEYKAFSEPALSVAGESIAPVAEPAAAAEPSGPDGLRGFAKEKFEGAKGYAADKFDDVKGFASNKIGDAKVFANDKFTDAKTWANDNQGIAVGAAAGVGAVALATGMAFLSKLRAKKAYSKGQRDALKKNQKEASRLERRAFEEEARGIEDEFDFEDEFIEYLEEFLDTMEV